MILRQTIHRFAFLATCLAASCTYSRREMVAEHQPLPADVIIVPGYELDSHGRGSFILWNRMVMAKLVLDRGDAQAVIVSGGVPKSGVTEAAKMREFGLELGIPAEKLILEPRADSSVENGSLSADLMVERGFKSAIVVSDPPHLRYALPVFRDAFEERGLTLYWTPVDYLTVRNSGLAWEPGAPAR